MTTVGEPYASPDPTTPRPASPDPTTPPYCCLYRISVGGDCGELLASGIAGIEVESCRGDTTTVIASVRDDSELYGLLDRLQDFALHIVSLTELGSHAA